MNKKISSVISSKLFAYGVIAIIMIIFFVSVYGFGVLNPTYTDWLLSGGDLSQHYLGWKAYRKGSWFFPIGCTDMLSYPSKTSIIFTESIPCFAVFF